MHAFAMFDIVSGADGRASDLRYLLVNSEFERFFGLKMSEVLGKTARELFPEVEPVWIDASHRGPKDEGVPARDFDVMNPDDLPALMDRLALPTTPIVFRFRNEDGSWRWYEAVGRKFQAPGGPDRVVVVTHDVTERMKGEPSGAIAA